MRSLTLLSVFCSLFYLTLASNTVDFGGSCTTADNKLQPGTFQFAGDCDSTTFCAPNGTCAHKGCRKDIFPFGYGQSDLPPLCSKGQFCPDEGDACQNQLAVGSACQLDRDDECQPPPDSKDLADNKYGRNVDGAVCLDFTCYWANVTVGNQCVLENNAFIIYGAGDQEAIDIVSRDNCKIGLYCDATQSPTICQQQKNIGESCQADKECLTMNCLTSQVCGKDIDAPSHVGIWVYIIVGIGIFGGMFGTLVALFIMHGKQRDREREKRLQYWREQNAFRQNIMQMRDTARASLLSLPMGANTTGSNSARSTLYSRDGMGSDESHTPILQNTGNRGSALKHQNYAEDTDGYEYDNTAVVKERENDGLRYRSAQAF